MFFSSDAYICLIIQFISIRNNNLGHFKPECILKSVMEIITKTYVCQQFIDIISVSSQAVQCLCQLNSVRIKIYITISEICVGYRAYKVLATLPSQEL